MNQQDQNGFNTQPEKCKNCGACPYCGRGGQQFIPYPVYPYWPQYPYWYNGGTITTTPGSQFQQFTYNQSASS